MKVKAQSSEIKAHLQAQFAFSFHLSAFTFHCWLVLLLHLLCGILAVPVDASDMSADQQLAFAEEAYARGQYFRAISEYQRFLFFFPDDARREVARFQIGMACYQDRNYAGAVSAFTDFINRHPAGERAWQAYLMLSRTYEALEQPGLAQLTLQNLIRLCDVPRFTDEAHYRLGWLYLDQRLTQPAQQHFGMVVDTQIFPSRQVLAELQALPPLSHKKPWLAGLLGVVPGAGYVYCGRYQDALVAFTLNSALILATVESFDKGHNALGSLLGLAAAGFYSGSIYGSVSAAHKYNQSAWQQVVKQLQDKSRLHLSLSPDGGGQIGLTVAF